MQAITTATTTLALAARRVISGSPATGLTVLAVVLAGCADTESTSPFSWLRPSAAPAGWRVARIATGALLHYPPGWRPAPGDAGTATAVLLDPGHHISGYLNVTPRQGAEGLGAAFQGRRCAGPWLTSPAPPGRQALGEPGVPVSSS